MSEENRTKPLTEKEYYALRELLALVSQFERCADMLNERAKLKEGLIDDLNIVRQKAQYTLERLLVTIPVEKLEMVRRDVRDIRVEVINEKVKRYRQKDDPYAYVPLRSLEFLLQEIIDFRCFACEKTGLEIDTCPYKKAVEAVYPFKLPGGSRTCCKFSGLLMLEENK